MKQDQKQEKEKKRVPNAQVCKKAKAKTKQE